MDVIQVRMPKKLIQEIDAEVKRGAFATRSDYIRSAIRTKADAKRWVDSITGIMPNDGKDSVQQVRELRQKMTEKDYFPDG